MADILWTGEEIEAAVKGHLHGSFAATGIQIDSRAVRPGDVFFAVQGRSGDGHDYVDIALEKGASGVVIDHGVAKPAVVVENTLKALEDLGQAAVVRSNATRIAVTGSVGKTTCRAVMEKIFPLFGITHASRDSLNNIWGVPLSLARMPPQTQYGIFEVGMNHANEITGLSKQIAPHIALITSIAPVHMEHLKTIENVALAKAEIFHGMDAEGIAILPRDSEQFSILLAEARTQGLRKIMSFGLHAEADMRLLDVKPGNEGSVVKADLNGSIVEFSFGIPGAHHALNALAALTSVVAAGCDVMTILPLLAGIKPVGGRGNCFLIITDPGKPYITVIDETHNASPVAVEAALKLLSAFPAAGRRIAVLGDMLELGEDAPAYHTGLQKTIQDNAIDMVLTCGPLMSHLAQAMGTEKTGHYPDSQAIAGQIAALVHPGDVIMVKGSRGSKMPPVIDALKRLGQVIEQTETFHQTGR